MRKNKLLIAMMAGLLSLGVVACADDAGDDAGTGTEFDDGTGTDTDLGTDTGTDLGTDTGAEGEGEVTE